MIEQILREELARSLASYLLGPERLEAMIRPTLERLGLDASEIDDIIRQARENLRSWQTDGPTAAADAVDSDASDPSPSSPERDPDDTPE